MLIILMLKICSFEKKKNHLVPTRLKMLFYFSLNSQNWLFLFSNFFKVWNELKILLGDFFQITSNLVQSSIFTLYHQVTTKYWLYFMFFFCDLHNFHISVLSWFFWSLPMMIICIGLVDHWFQFIILNVLYISNFF
jgi:hypothetical protein